MHFRYFLYLLLLLLVKSAFLLAMILYGNIGLGPDEAQYWTWSRFLDWGYYSKPPGIAWQIWLGTHIFGNTEWGVRSISLLIGFCFPLLIYLLGKCCRLSPAACFWSGAAMALSPIGMLSSFLAITDGGMVLFWTGACVYLANAIASKRTPNYGYLGLLVMCAALFKWPAYAFWAIVFLSWAFFRWLVSRNIVWGIILSAAALLPSIYWNAAHGWATFRHVLSTLEGGHGRAKTLFAGNVLEFIGSQAGLVTPLLFVLMLMALFYLIFQRKKSPPGVFFCGLLSIVCLAGALLAALFIKIQGNWVIFAYPSAFVAMAWYCCDKVLWGKKWLAAGTALSVALCLLMLSPLVPYKMNPFRHNVGWHRLEALLHAAGYDPERDFLFGDKYQMASLLSFYGEKQKRAYFFNLQGMRKNQFSYWPGMDREKGKRGFFVAVENVPQLDNPRLAENLELQLKPYFTEVHYLGMEPLFEVEGEVVKGALIFECSGYGGELPKDPELY